MRLAQSRRSSPTPTTPLARAAARTVEALERRTLFATFTWEGLSSGAWSDADAWAEGQVPGFGDDVVFPATSGTLSVDVDVNPHLGAVTISGSGYTLSGNPILLTGLQATSTGGNTITAALDFSGGTILDVHDGLLVLDGDVSGSTGITKTGAGSLTIGSASSVTPAGPFTIGAGDVWVNGAIYEVVNVASGAAINGDGFVDTLHVFSGAATYPGSGGPGTIATVSLQYDAGSTASFEVFGTAPGTGHDRLTVNDAVNIAGATLLVHLNDNPAVLGHEYPLIDGTNPGVTVTGAFSGLPEGGTFTVDGHTFEISYAGGASGIDVTITTVALPSTMTLQTSDATTVYGESVTFTATVSGTGPTPTGNVSLYDGLTLVDTVALDGSGVATFEVDTLIVDTHTMTAVYLGDSNYNGADDDTITQTVDKADTTVTVTPSAASAPFAGTLTVTATVAASAPGGGTPAGNVQFFEGTTLLGAVALDGAGTATLDVSTLDLGGHTITATYEGSARYNGSASATGATFTLTNNTPASAGTTDVDVTEDAPESVVDLTALFEDVEDGDNLTFAVTGTTNTGLFSFVTLDGSTLTLTYAADAYGTSDVTVRATDSNGGHADAVINVNVGAAPDPGRFRFASAAYSVNEGATVQLVVQRVGGSDGATTVEYAVTGGTASPGDDFVLADGTVSFEDGETAKEIAVVANTDDLEDGSQTLVVTLSEPGGGAGLDSVLSTTVTIGDIYNHAPAAGGFTVTHAPGEAVIAAPLAHASDPDGDVLTMSVLVPPSHGMATLDDGGTPSDPSDDRLLYTPFVGTYGDDSFVYVVSDGVKTATATVTVRCQGVALVTNATNPALLDLVVVGTNGNDEIRIYAGKRKGEVKVTIDGDSIGNFHATGRVIALGRDGDDTIELKYVKLGAVFYGGAGNDDLMGSRGSDILIGGGGDDRLRGWEKRDLLIGGAGLDEATEKKIDDVVIGDGTAFDDDSAANRLALFEILSAWNGKGSAAARANKLTAGVGPMSAGFGEGNVTADGAADVLTAASKKNWVLDLDAA